MSTHNICFHGEIRKIFTGILSLSKLWFFLFENKSILARDIIELIFFFFFFTNFFFFFYKFSVRIYKCGPMVTNCGQCLSMDPEYECGWCATGKARCSNQTDCSPADWLDRSATCPNPQILRVSIMWYLPQMPEQTVCVCVCVYMCLRIKEDIRSLFILFMHKTKHVVGTHYWGTSNVYTRYVFVEK